MDILEIFYTESYVPIILDTVKVKAKQDNKKFVHAIAYDENYSIVRFDFFIIGWLLQVLYLMEMEKSNSIGNINIKQFITRQNFITMNADAGEVYLRLDDESHIKAFYKENYFYISKLDFLVIGASLNLLNQILRKQILRKSAYKKVKSQSK